ncbi:uncharacterized protein Pyn_35635 [Prunus yedoensis var. nudiflora]|uniref:Aminotransferase-like plant mobile domain-containing protein n=1 Tax=Prunus yedoensis var. nudiflora TaxID=2094558 RepID=A0A314Z9U6_PRUYE|nr:uncharacterized protein Pyn_35635 [Prunus yedoensis var. nudiflora]
MAPKKSKAAKVSTGIPEWISEQAAAEHADEFLSTLAQEQIDILSPVYSPFPITLRGPFQTPLLGPYYPQAKPEDLLSLDTQLVRAPFSYGLEDVDWSSWEANLGRLGEQSRDPSSEDYSGFMMTFQGMSDREQEHMMFLLFWLNRFVFPNVDGSVSPEYMHLAEALHNESGLATGPFMLASLYRCLYQITVNPLDLAVCGPLWMVQLWLEWYFPELGTEDLVYLEDDVPAVALALAPKRLVSTEECFIFFRECRKRPSEIWFRSLGCDLPWFTDGGLHQAPSQWRELTNFRSQLHADMSLSCLVSRDLSFGGVMNDKQYSYGVEAYNPQFVSRQFGLVQPIPELRYSSANKSSSWRPGETESLGPECLLLPLVPLHLDFHEFWEGRLFSWLLNLLSFSYLRLPRLPFCPRDDGRGRKVYAEAAVAPPGHSSNRNGPGRIFRAREYCSGRRQLLWRCGMAEGLEEPPAPFSSSHPSAPGPSSRKRRAPSSPGFEDANPEGGVSEKRARMDSSSSEEDEPELDPLPAFQRPGKEKVSGSVPDDGRPQRICLKVRTIKLEEGVDLPPYEPLPAPSSAMARMNPPFSRIWEHLGPSGPNPVALPVLQA